MSSSGSSSRWRWLALPTIARAEGGAGRGAIRIGSRIVAVVAFVIVAGCSTNHQVESISAGPAETSITVPDTPPATVSPPSTDGDDERAALQPLDLRRAGFSPVWRRQLTGSRGNPVYLDQYVSDLADRPSPAGSGRDAITVNAAYVAGLGALVDEDLDNLAVPRDTSLDGEPITIDGRQGLLVREAPARWIAFAIGDWRIQVSTDAPPNSLTDDELAQIASQVEIR